MTANDTRIANATQNKQRIIIRKSGWETIGRLLEMEATYRPGGAFPTEHYHPQQDEHFEVLTGQIDVRIAGEQRTFVAGQSFDVPRGARHTMRNGGDDRASVLWQVRPALRTQQFYQTLEALEQDGRTNAKGMPGLIEMAVVLRSFANEIVLASPPRIVQTVALGLLAVIGRLRGDRQRHESYLAHMTDDAKALPFKAHIAQASIWIDRPAREVFDYISDYDNDNEWRKVVSMTQEPRGMTDVGTVTREEIDFLGQRYSTVARITRFEPGKRLVWESTKANFPLAGWRVVEAEDGGTMFTEVVTAQIPGAMRLFAPVMVRALRKQMHAEIAVLKRVLEQRQTRHAYRRSEAV